MPLQKQINEILDTHYNDVSVYKNYGQKFIHFAKSGTHQFFAHEIALIDTPIFQRLRYISQLGLAYNVFPTARHSRFEHSLGVTAMIDRMWAALSKNNEFANVDSKEIKDYYTIRFAALLHDIGHGPFSHLSEIIIREIPDIKYYIDKMGCKPHELISYYMVRSNLFEHIFDDISKFYDVELDQNEISNYIIGRSDSPDKQYLADLLNGQFDADKLDYFVRDSYFSGYQVSVGVDRLLFALGIDDVNVCGKNQKRLIVHYRGIQPLQDIIIAKTQMICNIYNHQKLRAIEHTLVPLLRRVISEEVNVYDKKISSPLDLIVIDDSDILNIYHTKDETIRKVCKLLKLRQFMKRALVISLRTIENVDDPDVSFNFNQMWKYSENIFELNVELRDYINKNNKECTEFDVALDLPPTPNLSEATHKFIKMNDDYQSLHEFINIESFNAFILKEWKGHIYSIESNREMAQIKGKQFLEERFDIKFNSMAQSGAKLIKDPLLRNKD